MGVALLEEQFQQIRKRIPGFHDHLLHCANLAMQIQHEMRIILDPSTPRICGTCKYSCCEGFPLEGWFSIEDYLLFRVKYGKPNPPPNRIRSAFSCRFLTPDGCSLPENLRPFTCVKINCKRLTQDLTARGMDINFNQLKSALDAIQQHLSSFINKHKLALAI